MKAKTELLLYQCLWMSGVMLRPTWRNMMGSFEEWSYRNGYLRQIHALEAQGWLESMEKPEDTGRVYRLTRKGCLRALGGCHPEERWNREWDGKWRMVVFDLPENRRGLRNELRRQLRAAKFGGLQGSVWISPDSVHRIRESLNKQAVSCGALTFFEGLTCGGERNSDIVASAWNFRAVHRAYDDYSSHAKQMPTAGTKHFLEALVEWGKLERALWKACMDADPLLPRSLWPEGYPGEKAWNERISCLHRAGRQASKNLPDN